MEANSILLLYNIWFPLPSTHFVLVLMTLFSYGFVQATDASSIFQNFERLDGRGPEAFVLRLL